MKSKLVQPILILSLLTNILAIHFPSRSWAVNTEGLLIEFSEQPLGVKLSNLTKKEHIMGGSGGVYVLEDATGTRFTVKYLPNHPNQMKEEILTDALYKALDIAVPEFAVYDTLPEPLAEQLGCEAKGIFRLSRFIERKDTTDEEIAKHLSLNFVADALFANWDIPVKGQGFRNVIMGKDGILYRIDNGGALRFRALGKLKINTTDWNPTELVELESLRNDLHDGSFAYGKLTTEDIHQQMKTVLEKSHVLFPTLWKLHQILQFEQVEDIQRMLAYRLHDLMLRLGITPTHNGNDSIVSPESAAGALSITNIKKEPHVLIGQRNKHKWWGNLGGKSDVVDGTVAQTASREVAEESANRIYLSPHCLQSSPSHTLYIGKSSYRMFMTETPFVEAKTLKEAIALDPIGENSNIRWVLLKALLKAIAEGEKVIEEGQETTTISSEDENLILHPPLYQMLQQEAVRQTLYAWEIEKKQPTIPYHTASIGQKSIQHRHLPPPPAFVKRKIRWPQVETEQNLFANHSRVPFGVNANGQGVFTRILKDEKTQTEDLVVLDPYLEEEKARKALVNHTLMIRNFKKFVTAGLREETTKKAHNKFFNMLQDLNKADEQKENSTPTEQPFELKELPYTASEAHLKELLGSEYDKENMDVNIKMILSKKFKDLFAITKELPLARNILNIEKLNSHAYVFYHGCLSNYAFVWDVLTQIRNVFFLTYHEETRTLRAFEDVFKRVKNLNEYILQMVDSKGNVDHYSLGAQSAGSSANITLFGNHGHDLCDSWYFFTGNSSCRPPLDAFSFLKNFLNDLRIKNVSLYVEQLEALYHKFYSYDTGGRLLQIFIKPEVIDEVAYVSPVAGNLVELKAPTFPPASQSINAIRKYTTAKINNCEARLFLKPEIMHGDGVKIVSYTLDGNSSLSVVPHIRKIVEDIVYSSGIESTFVYEGYHPIIPYDYLYKHVIGERIQGERTHAALERLANEEPLSQELLTFMKEHPSILEESATNPLTLKKWQVKDRQTIQGAFNIAVALLLNNFSHDDHLSNPEIQDFIRSSKVIIDNINRNLGISKLNISQMGGVLILLKTTELQDLIFPLLKSTGLLKDEINRTSFPQEYTSKGGNQKQLISSLLQYTPQSQNDILALIEVLGTPHLRDNLEELVQMALPLMQQITNITGKDILHLLTLLQEPISRNELLDLGFTLAQQNKKSAGFIVTMLSYCKIPGALNEITSTLSIFNKVAEDINQYEIEMLLRTIRELKVKQNHLFISRDGIIKEGMPAGEIRGILEAMRYIPYKKQQEYIEATARLIDQEMNGPDIAKIIAAMENIENDVKDPAFIEASKQLTQLVENHRFSEALVGLRDAKQALEDLEKFKGVIFEVQELLQWPELGVPLSESVSFNYEEAFKDTHDLNDFVETLKNFKNNGVDVSVFLINFSSVCDREKNIWIF